jgi:hypothetical protein
MPAIGEFGASRFNERGRSHGAHWPSCVRRFCLRSFPFVLPLAAASLRSASTTRTHSSEQMAGMPRTRRAGKMAYRLRTQRAGKTACRRTRRAGKTAYRLRTQRAGKTACRRTQKAGKTSGSMLHDKIDVLGNTLRSDNGAAGSTWRRHDHSKDGGTWRNRKRRSRRNYTSAHNRRRRKPKPT